jgi:hypothetical protein
VHTLQRAALGQRAVGSAAAVVVFDDDAVTRALRLTRGEQAVVLMPIGSPG